MFIPSACSSKRVHACAWAGPCSGKPPSTPIDPRVANGGSIEVVVVYVAFDDSGAWKQALGKELEAAEFEIDWNKLMRP